MGKTKAISKDSFLDISKMPNLPNTQPWKIHSYTYGAFSLAFNTLWGLANRLYSFAPFSRIQACIIMICIFSHWVDGSPCHRLRVSAVSKIPLEKIVLTWEIPSELHSIQGTHLKQQIVQSVYKIWPILQHFHCAYHPQSSNLVGKTNRMFKTQNRKMGRFFSFACIRLFFWYCSI